MKKLINFLSRNKALLFILLMGLTPLIWFKDGLLIAGGDFPIPVEPVGLFKATLYSWYPLVVLGEPNPHIYAAFPWYGFWAFLKYVGLSLRAINKLWFLFVFMLAGLSMYYLVSVVFEKEKHQVIALVASIFYMFNAYVMVVTPVTATPLLYGALPLILGLYIKGLRVEKSSIKYAVLIGIESLLIASAVGNPPIYAILGIMMCCYLIYHIVVGGKKEIGRSLAFTFEVAGMYLLINLWWLYPFISNNLMQAQSIKEAVRPTAGGSPFYEVVRLFGSWAFYGSHKGSAYFPFAHYYKTPLFIALTFIIPIVAFMVILFKYKNKYINYFLCMAIIGIFLAHGNYGTTGSIYNFFYSYIPFFWIFREPFAKFTAITAVSFAVLIGFTSNSFYWLLKKRHNMIARSLIVCIIAVILISSWPILTGDVIFSQRGEMKSFHVKIPEYWFEAANWFNNKDGDFKVLILPQNPSQYGYGGLPYKWGYGSSDITAYLIHQPLIIEAVLGTGSPGSSRESQELISLTSILFQSKRNLIPDIKKILNLMNVKYILQRNDVDLVFVPDYEKFFYSSEHIKAILNAQQDIRLGKSFGELDIYEIEEIYFLPHIYPAAAPTFVIGGINDLLSLVTIGDFQTKNPIFVSSGFEEKKGEFWSDRPEVLKDASIFIVAFSGEYKKGASQGYSDKNLIRTGDKYRLQVPKTAKYNVLIRKNSFLGRSKDLQVFFGKDSKVAASPLLNGENKPAPWVKLGNVFLEKGKHPLRITSSGLKVNVMNSGDLILKADNSRKNLNPPKIRFKKINPTKYLVNVSGAKDPYHLVFLESFHLGWKAYIREANGRRSKVEDRESGVWETWFKKPLPEDKHFLVNGYANDWYIEPKDAGSPKNYQIILEFWPQRLFYLGLGVSGLTLMTCLGYLVFIWARGKNRKKFMS